MPTCPTASSWPGGDVTPRAAPPSRAGSGLGVAPPGATRTGSSGSSAPRTGTSGAVHLPPSRVSMQGGAVDDMEPVDRGRRRGTVATFTIDRLAYSPSPPVVFAVVDFDGGGRFPVELTDVDADDRRHRRPGASMTFRRLFTADGIHDYFWKATPRPPGRRTTTDDLRSDLSRQRKESHGFARDQGPGRHRRDGLHPFRRALGQEPRRPHRRRRRGDLRLGRHDQGRGRRLLGRHGPVGHERHHAGQAAPAREQARHPGGELLRHRVRGPARSRLRGGLRRLRRGHGHGRREGQGLRLPGPQRLPHPQRRHGPHPDGGGHVLDGGPRLRQEVRRRRGRAAPRCWPASRGRTTTTAPATPRAQFRKEVSTETICASPRVAGRLGVFDCAGVADGAAAAIVVRAEDAHRYTDKPIYIKALSFAAGNGSGLIDPDYDYTSVPRVRRRRPGRLRPGRHHRPAGRAGHGRGPRLLHPDRARPDGGPRLHPAGHGLEGGAGRRLRPRRRPPRQPGRRPQELRPPGRRHRACG